MATAATREIENRLAGLCRSDQIHLLERLVRQIRIEDSLPPDWEKQLDEMAADPAIQCEIRAINQEFAPTLMDGLPPKEEW